MTTFLAVAALVAGLSAWACLLWLAYKCDALARTVTMGHHPAGRHRSTPGDNLTAAARPGDRLTADNAGPVTVAQGRTVEGLLVPYGVPGDTSGGSYAVEPGAFELPADLSRIKLLYGHDRERPIGYLTATRDDGRGLWGTFAIASGTDGDAALQAVRDRIRDGLSYEVSRVRYSADRKRVVGARLDAVALCSVPAYDDARAVAASRNGDAMSIEQAREILADRSRSAQLRAAAAAFLLAAPDATDADRATAREAQIAAAGPDDDGQDDGQDDDGQGDDGQGDGSAGTTGTAAAASVSAGRAPAGVGTMTGRRGRATLTAEQAVDRMAAALRGAVDAGQVNAALADVIPANDGGQGFMGRGQWIGELWSAQNVRRPFIESFGPTARLTSGVKVHGWRWVNKPEVGPWSGNKTEIPTNPVSTEPADAPIERTAGGWDVDRIYFDLGDAGFLQSFLAAATQDYGRKSEIAFAADVLAAASVAPDPADDMLTALDIAARALTMRGAAVSSIAMSVDLWTEYLGMTTAEAPWWLAKSGSVDLRTSETNVSQNLSIFAAPNLPAGTLIAGDRQALTYHEASPAPIRVQAVNVPQGGIDLGVYGYHATLVHDPTGLVRVNVAGAV